MACDLKVKKRKTINSQVPKETVHLSSDADSGAGNEAEMIMRGWPMLLMVALCACLAVGCGVYLLSGGNDLRLVVAVLAIIMGVALAAVLVGNYAQSSQVGGHLRQVRNDMRVAERGFRESHGRTEYLASQILDVRNRTEQVSGAIMAGLNDLKNSYASLAEQMKDAPQNRFGSDEPGFATFRPEPLRQERPVQPLQASFMPPFPPPRAANSEPTLPPRSSAFVPPQHAAPPPPPYAQQEAQQPAADGTMFDQLSTSLEPIVDLFTGKTSHYRLHLGMSKPTGEEVGADVLLHHADRTGLRAGFDVHAARDALALLRRLRQRDEHLNIFLPIGAATLQSEQSIDRLVDLRMEYPDVAEGLVLEIPHAVLAGLTDSGLEGLAQLARHGHSFSLANVSVNGIDLPSLAKLNVRYMTLNVASATGAEGPSPQVQVIAQSARALRVHIIVTNVADMKMTPFVSKISRYASGPAFAAPRKVKADVVRSETASYSAVA
jgi:EAL domain-containing protein (putative c-di-GMP-specific phosphodiesterase class I)